MRLRLLSMILLAVLASLALSGGKFSPFTASSSAAISAQDEHQDKEKHKHDGDDYDGKQDKHKGGNDDSEFTERDEFRQSYALAPGAQVRVSGMNGSVDVETSAGGAAEVYVLRTARSRSDLDFHKVVVEQTATGLVVRGVNDDKNQGWRGDNHQVRQRVTMKIPRNVDFTASGINGRATVGELDGPVKLSGINGRVDVAQARGYVDISGINGAVSMLIAQVSERGIRVSGVNGSVVLRFDGALNADLAVNGVNGSVNADMPNVMLQGRVSRTSFNAKIGGGGAPINVSGVNGSVKLLPRS